MPLAAPLLLAALTCDIIVAREANIVESLTLTPMTFTLAQTRAWGLDRVCGRCFREDTGNYREPRRNGACVSTLCA